MVALLVCGFVSADLLLVSWFLRLALRRCVIVLLRATSARSRFRLLPFPPLGGFSLSIAVSRTRSIVAICRRLRRAARAELHGCNLSTCT